MAILNKRKGFSAMELLIAFVFLLVVVGGMAEIAWKWNLRMSGQYKIVRIYTVNGEAHDLYLKSVKKDGENCLEYVDQYDHTGHYCGNYEFKN